ncbi:helix-turn-helix transcriptional regulator [Streptomyces sp. NPDC090077]|uniref:helix-turn-helix transcriptional regulator n=1 Tax=Streptomyces sp. NPDC090077 TaxID=3365938 RepID=UPI00382B711E
MGKLPFYSRSLSVAEEFISSQYCKVKLSSDSESSATSITCRRFPEIGVDSWKLGYNFEFDAVGMEELCLVSVDHGSLSVRRESGFETCRPGGVMLLNQPGRPFHGRGVECGQTVVLLEAAALLRAVGADEHGECPLDGFRPVSRAAESRLAAGFTYLAALADAEVLTGRLVGRRAADFLAALVLDCFPHKLGTELREAEGYRARVSTWKKATAFIEENARRDIGLPEIARAAHVSPRAVQYAFFKHSAITPVEYLRNVRLAGAHAELLLSDPHLVTVGEIARKWRFVNPGRFAGLYREAYGSPPSVTLRRI